MFQYKLSLAAKEDLVRIYEYGYYRFGVLRATKYYEMLFECFNKISKNPLMFPVVTVHKRVERFCVCGVDTIYFNINKNQIEIITIIGRQDYKSSFE